MHCTHGVVPVRLAVFFSLAQFLYAESIRYINPMITNSVVGSWQLRCAYADTRGQTHAWHE
eukprot:1845881-Pleurochrysis_carterae.AAC.1